MRGTVKLLPYPVYTLATDGRYIVTSGGGGGKEYGITNYLEFYSATEINGRTDLNVEASTSEGLSILDNAEYVAAHNVWIGSMVEGTVFFAYRPGRTVRVFGRVLIAKSKDDPSQTVARLAGVRDLFITGSSDGAVRVWKICQRLLDAFHNTDDHDDDSPYLRLGFTDDYAPTEPSSPCVYREKTTSTSSSSLQSELEAKLLKEGAEGGGGGGATDTEDPSGSGSDSNCSTDQDLPTGGAYPAFERRVANMVMEHRVHDKEVSDCHLSPDGKLAVSVCADYLVLYQVDPPKLLAKHKSSMRFKFCRFFRGLAKNRPYRIITMEWEPKKPAQSVISLWTYATGAEDMFMEKSACAGTNACSALAIRNDDMYIGVGFGTGEVAVLVADTFKCMMREQRHMLPVTDLAFLRDKLASGGADFYVIVKSFQGGLSIYLLTFLVPLFAYLLYLFTHRQF